MSELVRKIINESATWIAQQYFKAQVQFYAPVVLAPMTTVQRLAIGAPSEGTMVYDTTLKCPMVYSGTGWQYMATGCEPSQS